jgi:hypothetical protein
MNSVSWRSGNWRNTIPFRQWRTGRKARLGLKFVTRWLPSLNFVTTSLTFPSLRADDRIVDRVRTTDFAVRKEREDRTRSRSWL